MIASVYKATAIALVFTFVAAAPQALAQTAATAARTPTAPKPARLADGKPNWTGFWVPKDGLLEVDRGPGGVAGAGPNANTPLMQRDVPALKSPYKEQHERFMEEAKKGPVAAPVALCLPPGMPGMMGMIYGMEFLQVPKLIAITSEFQAASRRIWMDVKEHPPADELDESYTGDSIGHWEGDTLVVDTVGIRADVRIGQNGIPHSPRMHIVERFTQTSPGVLIDEITIHDPDAFERPWKQVRTYDFRPDLRLREYVCLENNRNVDAAGLPTFK